jgi:hypothetical protein
MKQVLAYYYVQIAISPTNHQNRLSKGQGCVPQNVCSVRVLNTPQDTPHILGRLMNPSPPAREMTRFSRKLHSKQPKMQAGNTKRQALPTQTKNQATRLIDRGEQLNNGNRVAVAPIRPCSVCLLGPYQPSACSGAP